MRFMYVRLSLIGCWTMSNIVLSQLRLDSFNSTDIKNDNHLPPLNNKVPELVMRLRSGWDCIAARFDLSILQLLPRREISRQQQKKRIRERKWKLQRQKEKWKGRRPTEQNNITGLNSVWAILREKKIAVDQQWFLNGRSH